MWKLKNSVAMGLILSLSILMGQTAELYAQEKGTTENGLTYTFYRKGGGVALDSGAIAIVNMRQIVMAGLDTLSDKMGRSFMPIRIMPPQDPVMEGLNMMSEGDSAALQCNITQIAPQLPPNIPDTAVAIFHISVDRAFADEVAYRAYIEGLEEERKKEEAVVIESYIAEKGWEAKKTASGLYYVIKEEGAGEPTKAGDRIVVHYTGKLLDGKKFDSSVDRGQPFTFNVGKGRVIKGWDEGFQLFKPGSKGVLIIPSHLGYGPRGAGGDIPPNAPLVFEVEFLENLGQ